MSFKIENTIHIYTGKNLCVSECIGSYYGLFESETCHFISLGVCEFFLFLFNFSIINMYV